MWFGDYLPQFIILITPTSPEIAESLNLLQRQHGLHADEEAEQLEDGLVNDLKAISFQDNIIDTPLTITRAALYIYLNAMVSAD